jgi:hypothetical protein
MRDPFSHRNQPFQPHPGDDYGPRREAPGLEQYALTIQILLPDYITLCEVILALPADAARDRTILKLREEVKDDLLSLRMYANLGPPDWGYPLSSHALMGTAIDAAVLTLALFGANFTSADRQEQFKRRFSQEMRRTLLCHRPPEKPYDHATIIAFLRQLAPMTMEYELARGCFATLRARR